MAETERVTITLPKDLVAEIDTFESNRSRFVADAVRRELAERHRERLRDALESVADDAMELTESGFEEWAAATGPDDEHLVDPTAGVAVSWLEGRGWIRRSH